MNTPCLIIDMQKGMADPAAGRPKQPSDQATIRDTGCVLAGLDAGGHR